MQNRQFASPRLFRCFADDILPAAEPFAVGLACHTALAGCGDEDGDADLCTFLENYFEVARLKQRLIQGYPGSRLADSEGFVDNLALDLAAL
jgi:hypothetical protein